MKGNKNPTPKKSTQSCVIKVVGIGGGGCNAVGSMINMGIDDVEFYAINTDAQHLQSCRCTNKLQIGDELTKGLGCGADPELGRQAADAARDEITDLICDANMLFITAGMGGGSGTGGAPVVASIARELGILTVAIVTRPFKFEGPSRIHRAEGGLDRLRQDCDSLIIVSNDRLLEVAGPQATLIDSFEIANQVLGQGVRSIAEMISKSGLINVDFADVKAMMIGTGGAVMGVGKGSGDTRASDAVREACSSPMLDKLAINGAQRVLMSFTGPEDLTLHEVYEAASQVHDVTDPNVDIIFGVRVDDKLDNIVKVTILATGFSDEIQRMEELNSIGKRCIAAPTASAMADSEESGPSPDQILTIVEDEQNSSNDNEFEADDDFMRTVPAAKVVDLEDDTSKEETWDDFSYNEEIGQIEDLTNFHDKEDSDEISDFNLVKSAHASKKSNGKHRKKAVVEDETPSDIFDAIDEAKEMEQITGGSILRDPKKRRDATKPEARPDEEDLEIPAFLRRKRGTFRIF